MSDQIITDGELESFMTEMDNTEDNMDLKDLMLKSFDNIFHFQIVDITKIRRNFLLIGGTIENQKNDLINLLTFLQKYGSKINQKIHSLSQNNQVIFYSLIHKYNIKDNSGNDYNAITLLRLCDAFPLQNLKIAMEVKPRTFIADVDFTLPQHWLSITGAASLIPKNRKYNPLMKIVVYYQNQIRHFKDINGIKNFGTMMPKEFCKIARQSNFPEEDRITGLIMAGIIEPTTKDIVEQVKNFANFSEVMATQI